MAPSRDFLEGQCKAKQSMSMRLLSTNWGSIRTLDETIRVSYKKLMSRENERTEKRMRTKERLIAFMKLLQKDNMVLRGETPIQKIIYLLESLTT